MWLLLITAVYFVPNYLGLYSVKVISTENSVQRLRNKKLNKTKCDFLGQIRLVTSSPDSPEEVQKCTGQKCTKHQLVLLTIFNVLGPKKANKCWNSPQIDHRLLLVHSWLSGTKIWRRLGMVKSAKSTSSCFVGFSLFWVPKRRIKVWTTLK